MERGIVRIVVIGGSAGSLAPLKTIIADLPEDLGRGVHHGLRCSVTVDILPSGI